MLSQVGYREKPVNCNKFSRYFGYGCQYWCADFVSWNFDSTGNKNKKVPWGYPSAVSSILSWAKKNGHLVKSPKPGDIFIMKARGASHTGLVRKVKGNLFYTVEGNTSNQVMKLRRNLKAYPYLFVRVPS
ncbi:MAG: CHAP domain-containing protein [Acaryochloris sp. CRU_2_0]|nr:CHAP domain-containing protein [Acaryochloris sp. CRU_2_0]